VEPWAYGKVPFLEPSCPSCFGAIDAKLEFNMARGLTMLWYLRVGRWER